MVNRLDSMARRAAAADRAMSGTLNRLSSGRRIVSAADDAAGMSIGERLRAQATGSLRAQRNVEDGISLARTADAVLGEVHEMLQRARELAVRYHHGALSSADRTALQAEADALGAEAGRLVAGATFNGVSFLGGGTLSVQVGTGDSDAVWTGLPDVAELLDQDAFYISGAGATITVTVPTSGGGNGGGNGNGNGNGNGGGNGNGWGRGGVSASATISSTTVSASLTVTTTTTTGGTSTPIARIDQAIDAITMYRGTFGAFQNRLEHSLNTLATSHESLVAAESRIRDADMAAEVVALTRNQVKGGVSRAMTAQARVQAHNALRLLVA
jgi:flagellin